MAQVKRIYILVIKVNKLFYFFVVVFSKRNRKHVLRVSIELQQHSWKFGRTWKHWKHSSAACVPTAFLVLPNFQSCWLDRYTVHVFYFLNNSDTDSWAMVYQVEQHGDRHLANSRSTYWPSVGQYIDQHSVEMSTDSIHWYSTNNTKDVRKIQQLLCFSCALQTS